MNYATTRVTELLRKCVLRNKKNVHCRNTKTHGENSLNANFLARDPTNLKQ